MRHERGKGYVFRSKLGQMPVIPRLDGIFYDPVFAVLYLHPISRCSGFINKIIIFTRRRPESTEGLFQQILQEDFQGRKGL